MTILQFERRLRRIEGRTPSAWPDRVVLSSVPFDGPDDQALALTEAKRTGMAIRMPGGILIQSPEMTIAEWAATYAPEREDR